MSDDRITREISIERLSRFVSKLAIAPILLEAGAIGIVNKQIMIADAVKRPT